MFHHQNAKMAPTDNVPSTFQPEANNLLSFVSSATANIHEALGKPSKKRTVNIKKYAQKRVKRLEQGSGRRGTTSASTTKSKSAQLSPPSAKKQVPAARPRSSLVNVGPSNSWPELPLPPMPPAAPQTVGLPTSNYPTTYSSHPPMQYSYSDPSIYSPPASSAAQIDDDIDIASLLSDFDDVSAQQHMCSPPTSGSVTPCYTPQPTLESQVAIGELPYSPPSDCGSVDEIYGDSAYSSPISYGCSPAPMAVSSTNWTPSIHSPPMMMASQCSVACSTAPCSWMETPMSLPLTTDCSWMAECSPLTVPAPMPTIIDQGPPATPTVSQVLSEFGSFP